MNVCGLTDSLADLSSLPKECPACHSTSHISHGLCLGCLLQAGVSGENSDAAGFAEALDEIAVPDTQWRLGNYEILEEIGRGGMGVIYRARQRHSRRIVALKRILSYHADSQDTLERFRREAEAASSLDHPNILPIYEVAQGEDGVPFFSLKFATGGSLQEVGRALRDNPREIVRLMARVTRAVQYAHRQGILHRDLKPGNILLDSRSEPLVSDFGLAKWLDTSSDLTRTLTIFGTPGYIAPEQAEGHAASLKPTADIYSLGAILFDLLAGRPPFLGEHALAVIRQAAEKPAPKLRSLVKGADRDLETICARCLERDAAARYRSAGDLAEDLERWLEGRPIIARPVSPPVRLWRWSRRNPIVSGAGAIASLLGIALVIIQVERSRLEHTLNAEAIFRRSTAVLPFLNLETATPDSGFAKSFADALQAKIAHFGPARIIPVAGKTGSTPGIGTVNDIKTIGRSEGTRTALGGTLRQVNGKLSASIQLLDIASGETILRRHFVVDSESPALRLSSLAAPELSPVLDGNQLRKDPVDPAVGNEKANDYLRAGWELEKRHTSADVDHALECYRKAIEAAPGSVLARADFVRATIGRMYLGPLDRQIIEKADVFGHEAVQLNANVAESHRALGTVYLMKGDFSKAHEEGLAAIELSGLDDGPNFVGMIARFNGRPDLALRWFEIAKHRQPGPADDESTIGDCWADLCDDSRALAVYERVSELHPEIPEGWMGICRIRLLQGDFDSARKIYQENSARFHDIVYTGQIAAEVEFFSRNYTEAERLYTDLEKTDPNGGASFYGAVSYQSALARLHLLKNTNPSNRDILERCLQAERKALTMSPQHPRTLYGLAAIESSSGEVESAIDHLRAAFEHGWIDYRSTALDPRFDSLHGNPQFDSILANAKNHISSLQRNALAQ